MICSLQLEPLDLGDSVTFSSTRSDDRALTASTSLDGQEKEKEELERKHVSGTSSLLQGTVAKAQALGATATDLAKPDDKLNKLKEFTSSSRKGKEKAIDDEDSSISDQADPAMRNLGKSQAPTEEAFVAGEMPDGAPIQQASQEDDAVQPFGSDQARREPEADDEIGAGPRRLAKAKRKSFEESYGRPSRQGSADHDSIEDSIRASEQEEQALSTSMHSQASRSSFRAGDPSLLPSAPIRHSIDASRRPSSSSIRQTKSSASGGTAGGELMLDMSGYKTEDPAAMSNDASSQNGVSELAHEMKGQQGTPLTSEELGIDMQTEAVTMEQDDPDVMALTRALLRYAESDKPDAGSGQYGLIETFFLLPAE